MTILDKFNSNLEMNWRMLIIFRTCLFSNLDKFDPHLVEFF